MVNGVVTTENLRSQAGNLFIEDAIQETTVLTGAHLRRVRPLHRRRGQLDHQVGRKRVHGIAPRQPHQRLPGQLMSPTQTAHGQAQQPSTRPHSAASSSATVSGSSAPAAKAETTRDASTTSRPEPRAPRRFLMSSATLRTLGRKTHGPDHSQAHPHRLATWTRSATTPTTGSRAPSTTSASLTTQGTPETLASAFYNGIITSNLLLEGQYSKRTMKFVGSGSKFTDLILGTLMRDSSNGNARFNSPTFCGVCDTETAGQPQHLGKGNYFLSTNSFGNHNFVGRRRTTSTRSATPTITSPAATSA